MSGEDELMELVLVGVYLVLAPASAAIYAVPLGLLYGVVAGLRSRRNALLLIAVPAPLAALLVTLLVCGSPIWPLARQQGLPSNGLFPIVVATLITFTVALVVWLIPIGAAVSVARVFATRGWRPTIVTLAAALLIASVAVATLFAMPWVPMLPLDSQLATAQDSIAVTTVIFIPIFLLCCMFFGPIVRLAGRSSAKAEEAGLLLPLEPLVEGQTRQTKWTRRQRVVVAGLACSVAAALGLLGAYSVIHFTGDGGDQSASPAPSPHPLPPTWTPTATRPAPTQAGTRVVPAPQVPTPTSTLVIPQSPAGTPLSCPPAPTAQMAPELSGLRDSVETDEERLMVEFLMNRYNPALGLVEESPNVGRGKFYVHSDAYLAGLETSWYDYCWGLRPNPHWTVLRGQVVSEEVFSYGVQERKLDEAKGVYSIVDSPGIVWTDWLEYGDRVLLAALNARSAADSAREKELMAIAHTMWDGICLRDKSYYGYLQTDKRVTCETYKTALYYRLTENRAALDIVLGLQELDPASKNFGGIYTHYGEDGKPFPWIDANCETTAVVLLALRK